METLVNTGTYHLDRNAFVLGGEPMIYHCHHYNVFLQMAIEETKEYIDVYPILIDSAHEVVYSQFSNLFKDGNQDTFTRKKMVEDCFSGRGFGKIDLSNCDQNGGVMETTKEHYAYGWSLKFGKRKKEEPGVSFFTCGFLAGALEAIYDLEFGSLESLQTKCLTHGDSVCQFEIQRRRETMELSPSPGEGSFQTFAHYPEHDAIDYMGIREALINMEIRGDEESGYINAFGVFLTHHYANYYNLISLRTMLTMEHEFGEAGVSIVKELLTEAGHVCVFNTLGGIMQSAEWNALIKPMISDLDHWTHGIVACANALGWGLWEIEQIDANGTSKFRVTSSYESNGFLALYDKQTTNPICCFLDGALAGVMNLIYHGDITSLPTLDESYYNKTFKSKGRFGSTQTTARTMGAGLDEFSIKRV